MAEGPEYVLTPDDARRQTRTVWTLLLVSLPVYALVALVAEPPPEWQPAEHALWSGVYLFGTLGVLTAAAIPLLRRWMLFAPLERGDLDRRSPEFYSELRTTSAATWAMATSLSIYGLLAYFFVYQFWVFALFFVPSVALFFIFRPPDDLIDEASRPAGISNQ